MTINQNLRIIIALLYTWLSHLFSFFCCKTHTHTQNMVPEAASNCLHSSNHLSSFISPFSHLLIHQTIIISLSLRSHPSLSFSITQPHSLLIFLLPSFSSHDTIRLWCLSLSFSPLTFFPKLCCQLLVISNWDFFVAVAVVVECCVLFLLLCFNVTQLADRHTGYYSRVQEHWTSVCMSSVNVHVWSPLLSPSV